MTFTSQFESGYFIRHRVSLVEIVCGDAALVTRIITHMDVEVRYKLFGHLEATSEQRRAWAEARCRQPPWEPSIEEPGVDWTTTTLPHPIFTNITVDADELVLTRVYCGVLKPRTTQFRPDCYMPQARGSAPPAPECGAPPQKL